MDSPVRARYGECLGADRRCTRACQRLLLIAAVGIGGSAVHLVVGASQLAAGGAVAYVTNLAQTVYITNLGETTCLPPGCEWRVFDPTTGQDQRLWRLPAPPENVHWDAGFATVYFRVAGTVFESPWMFGAEPVALFGVPNELVSGLETIRDLWRDRETGAWRMKSVERTDDRDVISVWEYSSAMRLWLLLERLAMAACESGDSRCDTDPTTLVEPRGRVTMLDLLDRMRVHRHLERAQPGGSWSEGAHQFPSTTAPGASVRVDVLVGDSHHAWAPLSLVGASGSESLIVDRGDSCGNQLAFEEHGGFLLVATEYLAACGRVAEMQTGRTVATLPSASANAVWVPLPGRP